MRAVSAELRVTRGAGDVMLAATAPVAAQKSQKRQNRNINFLLVVGRLVWNWGHLVHEVISEFGAPNDPSFTVRMPFSSCFGKGECGGLC